MRLVKNNTNDLQRRRYLVIETILSKRIQNWLAVLLLLVTPLVQAQSESFTVSDIRVEGLQRISAGSVFASMPLAVGDVADAYSIRAASRSLFATGNFDDIRIGRDGNCLLYTSDAADD